jgi:hypothetical protein
MKKGFIFGLAIGSVVAASMIKHPIIKRALVKAFVK